MSNKWRNNYAVLDQSFALSNDSCYFNGDFMNNTRVDKIAFYDKYMVAKGNYWALAGNQFSMFTNQNTIKVVDLSTNTLLPWVIDMPSPFYMDQMIDIHRNKLYIHNRHFNASPFKIYCFPPVNTSSLILYAGSALPNPPTSIALCSPDNGANNIFIAPIRYADSFVWNYSGSNATLSPIGDGSTAQLFLGANASSGTLSVTGSNDCGLSSQTATLNVIVNSKPDMNTPASPLSLICDPDSVQLSASSSFTNVNISWRKNTSSTYTTQPCFTKIPGSFYVVVKENTTLCRDRGMISVNNFQIYPNAKITSHVYPGPLTPLDTVTSYQASVNITGASDTSGVTISWKSIANNSVMNNPVTLTTLNNLKLFVTRNANNCVDSSLIVLVAQNNTPPSVSISNYSPYLNCSIYSLTLSASISPSACTTLWNGPLKFYFCQSRRGEQYRKATEFDYSQNSDAYMAYKRMGYGISAGYEHRTHSIKASYFSAKDDIHSLSFVPINTSVTPMENTAVSVNGRTTLSKYFTFEAEYALSALTRNLNSPVDLQAAPDNKLPLLFSPNATSQFFSAYKGSLGYKNKNVALNFNYERVDPEYRTLGAYYFNNDLENFTLAPSLTLWGGKLNVAANTGLQRNNLNKEKLNTTTH